MDTKRDDLCLDLPDIWELGSKLKQIERSATWVRDLKGSNTPHEDVAKHVNALLADLISMATDMLRD